MKYVITSEVPIWIKQTPSLTGKNIGLVYKDTILDVQGESNGYLRIDRGYVLKSADNMTLVQTLTADNTPLMTTTATPILTATDQQVNAEDEWEEDWTVQQWSDYYKKKTENSSGKVIRENTIKSTGGDQETKTNTGTVSPMDITMVHMDNLMKGDNIKSGMLINNIGGIYGMPYQWLPHVDPRFTSSNPENPIMGIAKDAEYPGRVYTERIVSKIPLLIIAPGVPRYNATGNKSIAQILKEEIKEGTENLTKELQDNNGIFYSFEYATIQYFQYVNPILRLAAKLLHLEERTFTPSNGGSATRLKDFDWSTNFNKAIHGDTTLFDWSTYIGEEGSSASSLNNIFAGIQEKLKDSKSYTGSRSIAFYLDSDFSANDSMTNSTQESSLKTTVNNLSDRAKDLNFMLGFAGSSLGLENDLAQRSKNLIDNIGKSSQGSSKRFFASLLSTASTLAAGGKLMFPSFWGDSNFGRTYNFRIKLVSPDYDDYSWYINILVPLVHLICLTLPQKASNSFSYISPFLVRAFYKGLYNCDLGIISNLGITRGAESGWTQSGLPTIVEVSIDIQDLYDGLAMSKSDVGGANGMFALLKNPIYLDFIANMCGVNLNEPDVRRLISFYKILAAGSIKDTPSIIEGNIMQMYENFKLKVYGKMQYAGL